MFLTPPIYKDKNRESYRGNHDRSSRSVGGRSSLPPPSISAPRQEAVRLFSSTAEGLAVNLPGWRYPLVCELATGTLHYDNFGGRWGDERELNRFMQAYAVEKTRIEARKQSHSVTEYLLADGSIRLSIQVAGGAA